MRSITVRELEQLRAGLAKGLSAVTVNVYLRHLRGAFATAHRWDYLLKNPMRQVAFLEEPERDSPPVIEEVLKAILDQADEEQARAIRIALYTGLRPFELVRLTYGHIAGGVIRILGKRNRRREVPILGECADLIGEGKPDERVIKRWTTAGGLSHMFRDLADDAGYRKKVRLYDLRHTAATVWTMAGMDPWAVSKLMGHTDIKTTQRYVTVTRRHLEAILGKVEGFYDKNLTAGKGQVISIEAAKGNGNGSSDS